MGATDTFEGISDGWSVGDVVVATGVLEGISDGCAVGEIVGATDTFEGISDGWSVGDVVVATGVLEGISDGCAVGEIVGATIAGGDDGPTDEVGVGARLLLDFLDLDFLVLDFFLFRFRLSFRTCKTSARAFMRIRFLISALFSEAAWSVLMPLIDTVSTA